MDIVWLLLLGIATVFGVRQVLARRRPAPPEDEWVLPPEPGTPGIPTTRPPYPEVPAGPPVLDREALLHRDRTLDPSKWDNSPDSQSGTDVSDPDAGPVEGELPSRVDRSFLEALRSRDTDEQAT